MEIQRQHSREDLVNFIHETAEMCGGSCRHLWEMRINEQVHVMGFSVRARIVIAQWYENGQGWDVWVPGEYNDIDLTRKAVIAAIGPAAEGE